MSRDTSAARLPKACANTTHDHCSMHTFGVWIHADLRIGAFGLHVAMLPITMRAHVTSLSILAVFLVCACGPAHTVSLLHSVGAPITQTPSETVPLEVVTRSTGIADPLIVKGADVSYADLETTVGTAISSAAAPWAEHHQNDNPEGWQLLVELIEASANYSSDRLATTIGVRLTLRTRTDHRYIAQSQASCRNAALTAPDKGAEVLYGCMSHMGRDVASWLAMVDRPIPK